MQAASKQHPREPATEALLCPRFLRRLAFAIAVLAGATIALSIGGRMLGERIALAGHSESSEIQEILIGEDHLRLPANVIRFDEQRRNGQTDRLDLYLTWPEMEGYSNRNRLRFNDVGQPESLLFLQLSQSTMSRDMSGRVQPIYTHLFAGEPEAGPAGLTLRRLRPGSGYEQEALLLGALPDGATYAVRCLIPGSDQASTGADCQRDIHIGDDLSLLYRFSSRLLPQWQAMEQSVRSYMQHALTERESPLPRTNRR
ncbi:hypothetical protein [Mycoplana dimorpha]|uniref:Transmembrane anchored protein n=1 Tax=Mycoplana dimorpha TaxID=28320 RepID=A0A2T5B7K5_MYCDI|nr:hypothetical protein [Mycoplana dimorpha]PTM94959.1 hypothetical protein C7449_10422 [Mycoplana dimorpha]